MPNNKKQFNPQTTTTIAATTTSSTSINSNNLNSPQSARITASLAPAPNSFTTEYPHGDSDHHSFVNLDHIAPTTSTATATATILHPQDLSRYENSQNHIPFYKKELPSPLSWPEPTTLEELEQRLQRLLGRSIAELSQLALLQAPNNSNGAKGYVGLLIELFLGAHAHNLPGPDFMSLGIELKTMPVGFDFMPQENTFICNADLAPRDFVPFTQSALYQKLQHILFVLILAPQNSRLTLGERRVLGYFFFNLPPDVRQTIETDYNEFQELLLAGHAPEINGTMGTIVKLSPHATKANELVQVTDSEGESTYTKPRGYYLRASFTRQLLQTFIKEQGLAESLPHLQDFKRQFHLEVSED